MQEKDYFIKKINKKHLVKLTSRLDKNLINKLKVIANKLFKNEINLQEKLKNKEINIDELF